MSTKIKVWLGIIGIAAICLLVFFSESSKPKVVDPNSPPAGNDEKPITYTKTYMVGAAPVRIDIPFGYRLDCQMQDAPIDTRTNLNPEWIDTDAVPPHTNGGKIVTWREFRLNGRFDGKSPVIATFTKRF